MRPIKISFLFLLSIILFPCRGLDINSKISPDTLHVSERKINRAKLEKFKIDSRFQYGRPQEAVSPWQRFWIWLLSIIGKFFYYATQTFMGGILFYASLVAVLVWVILRLFNIDAKDIFYRKSAKSSINFTYAEENIHELNFESLIEKSVQKGLYRDAVRLTFLFSLKILSDHDIIHWMPGKTTDEYLLEIKQKEMLPNLQELRYYFDHAWYGHFEIDQQTYFKVRNSFEQLAEALR
jgi:hypothetical protein